MISREFPGFFFRGYGIILKSGYNDSKRYLDEPMRILLTVFYLLLVLLGISFAALNAASVQVNLYVVKLTLPISVLMATMLGLGMLLGFFLFFARYWSLKSDHRRISNQLKLTEREIKNLRSIPIQDQH